ncbi:expressed unknown protein [Ectocarpus siliculosus]|uniref:Prolyl 4-hydroxylase alpha subunit Fe(2+) 2OG dioxygenase domain-containing protein n=1 Tax=Ectocarpus siliculosus TaxID=2880 RepID=D8LHC0_ECTSI|nr:expressed unknown protein [Ectocarpus siliculosus]|eukprot:CBN74339.1 expressed unknown protein [Ectocarpus siliculosus]
MSSLSGGARPQADSLEHDSSEHLVARSAEPVERRCGVFAAATTTDCRDKGDCNEPEGEVYDDEGEEEEEEEEEVVMGEEEMLQMLDKATARAASGVLAPAHGGSDGGGGTSSINGGGHEIGEGDGALNEEGLKGEHPPAAAPGLTGYVKSVRDDLTVFVSSEREAGAAAGGAQGGAETGAVGRTLAILARLGEDLGRMVRLRGRVEHQLAVYPAGIGARYERHRDAYPDDGEDDYDEDPPAATDGEVNANHNTEAEEGEGADGGSVSFRRITAICYLRRSGAPWQASDGGALRLYPPTASPLAQEKQRDNGNSGEVVWKLASWLDLAEEHEDRRQDQQQPTTRDRCSSDAAPAAGGRDAVVGDDIIDGRTGGSNSYRISSCRSGSGGEDGRTGGGDIGHGSGGGGGGTAATSTGESASSRDDWVGDGAQDSAAGGGGTNSGGNEAGGEGPRQGFIDVPPLAGRAVVFFSGAVEHEVLPVTGPLPRAALTTWFH